MLITASVLFRSSTEVMKSRTALNKCFSLRGERLVLEATSQKLAKKQVLQEAGKWGATVMKKKLKHKPT